MTSAIDTAIAAILNARGTGQTVSAVALPDAEAAYAVQDGVAAALGWFGTAPPRHWKSGGPSRSAVLTHAPLPPQGVWNSPANVNAKGSAWPFHFRGIEAEIALRLARDVDSTLAATLDTETAHELVDAMCVTIEVVDSRWTEARSADPLPKLADLQSHGALVLGAWVPFVQTDWTRQICNLTIGDKPVQSFVGTHAMADPCFVLPAWLRHTTRHGAVIPAGTVVTTGTWCGLPMAAAGERVVVEFPGVGRAEVQL